MSPRDEVSAARRGPVPSPAPPIAAPSILSADFARLADAVTIVDPARDWLHCDVMDNHFVPNLTFGPLIVGAVRALTTAFVDVHLMITEPARIAPEFRRAGADQITVHLEACNDLVGTLATVRGTGARVGLAVKPGSRLANAERYMADLDTLLVMTVEPGFGGQSFMRDMLEKIAAAAAWRTAHGARYLIEVDGGIAPDTARECRAAGADVFVAGHSVFRQPDARAALEALRQAFRGDASTPDA
ncbi:MAG: ribulose-phosphate 3-epimerase [Candidatus Eisenbacteria bacterium]|uniref:Ribulose-phosphate 3-epimerase n=1 Tax=Eiseniibacteriota bacterium TaxID=2212470 RepID=A0A9D6QKI4_UNCEI|nr:ribulose-phosphate 3-epimerase [Candidatus Eisenbacteria bacterium]MBI3540231.1 ribulose-phosphate 3-epimerase [Candidatus Eisenbacteria bacterium]